MTHTQHSRRFGKGTTVAVVAATAGAFFGATLTSSIAQSTRNTEERAQQRDRADRGDRPSAMPEMIPGHPLESASHADPDEMMAKWMQLMQPGPMHNYLATSIGEWETNAKFWMGGPAAPPTESTGTSTIRWKIEGRFIEEEYRSQMMGMPMLGFGTFGYDNFKKQFVGTWIDSMGTGISAMRGSISPDGKVLTMFGEMDEPMTGEIGKAIMYRTTKHNENNHTFEMFEIVYGEPFKVIEINYNRKGTNTPAPRAR